MDINEFVNNVNDPRLKESIRRLGNTPDGQRFLNSITQQDKENLLRQLKGLSANGITADILLKQLNNNPNIINQLGAIIGKKR